MKPTTEQASAKLATIIDAGRANAGRVIDEIQTSRPRDAVVRTADMSFSPMLEAVIANSTMAMHDNALTQAMGRADVPIKYGRMLQGSDWGKQLLANSLNEIFHHSGDRVLLRAVHGQVRAVLSDSYRRLDAAPVVDAFASAVSDLGAVPVDGVVGDLRLSLRAILPELLWVGDDPVVLGVSLQTSDFGRGQLALQTYTLRLVCTNGMIGENVLRAIHLGRRIQESSHSFSQRTHDLDSDTMASAVKDLVLAQLNPGSIRERQANLERAGATEIDSKAAFVELKKVLTKGETDAAIEAFTFGTDEQVPQGKTAWRLSNALSWISRTAEPDRRLDLERIAGELLTSPAAKAAMLAEAIA